MDKYDNMCFSWKPHTLQRIGRCCLYLDPLQCLLRSHASTSDVVMSNLRSHFDLVLCESNGRSMALALLRAMAYQTTRSKYLSQEATGRSWHRY